VPPASYERLRSVTNDRPLPCAVLDLDFLESNAREAIARSGNLPIRLGTKSIRSVGVLRHLLSLSPRFRGLLAYSASEAAWLAEAGFDDIVVAYPTVDSDSLDGVARALSNGRRITLMVDDYEHVRALSAIAESYGVEMPVCIDLDMSSAFPGLYFGVQRSPVRSPHDAVRLAQTIGDTAGVRLDGLMGYEAQISGVQDALPHRQLKNFFVRALKARSMREISARRGQTVAALREAGFPLRFVNGGGTGSLERTAADPSVTEATAGSMFFGPALFDGYYSFKPLPAMTFALPVVRRPEPNVFTCLGGGYIASGSAGEDRLPTPYLPAGGKLLDNEGAGEVQTPVAFAHSPALRLGDPIFFRHAKAGEVCERFDRILCIRGSDVVDEFATYRGDGRCFF
jgi:D-serine deaminase-like pyridoxal phosphate-dependent protein